MKRSYLIAAVVVVVAVAALYFYQQSKGDTVVDDLIAIFPDDQRVEKRSSIAREAAYHVGPEAIKGETRPAIYMHPTSRLIYNGMTIPDSARLRVFIGVKEDAWDKESDGVQFRFGVSDGNRYDELLIVHVDPKNNPADRQWIRQDIDLSAYAGQQLKLIFNTDPSPRGRPVNAFHDFAVWGEPAIVVKR